LGNEIGLNVGAVDPDNNELFGSAVAVGSLTAGGGITLTRKPSIEEWARCTRDRHGDSVNQRQALETIHVTTEERLLRLDC
jgi:hypothetical protein